MIKQVLTICRSRCRVVYLVGEHGTAAFYAVCELPEHIVHLIAGDTMLFFFSIILLTGIALIGIDKLLSLIGM